MQISKKGVQIHQKKDYKSAKLVHRPTISGQGCVQERFLHNKATTNAWTQGLYHHHQNIQ